MEAETAGVNGAQVEELQGIRHEVRAGEGEQSRLEIPVVAQSALLQAGDVAGTGKIVGGVDGTGVECDLVVESGMDRVEGQRQVFGFAISSGDGKSHIDAAIPAMHYSGMQGFIVLVLFFVVA